MSYNFSATLEHVIKFHGSPHISSVNLMACMGTLTLIAKMRPQYISKVIIAYETLHSMLNHLNCVYDAKLS